MSRNHYLDRIRENIRLVLVTKNLSQTEVADRIGISPTYVSQILSNDSGVPPSREFVEKLAAVTGVSFHAILDADLSKMVQRVIAFSYKKFLIFATISLTFGFNTSPSTQSGLVHFPSLLTSVSSWCDLSTVPLPVPIP
ncbi:MAG: helix-turn-helix transcriptional regulator [Candidatus Omnitrophica bacterium]|nr:helix-turn-helix transcriptional regulator [Candidatus Omnitrophota bacterium]MCA9441776.1 helix-turn-helix transcriptional regulator [Candidatus Omnitrophota bacterium]